MELENKVYRLPDYYDKSKTSNNYKVLEIARSNKETILNELKELRDNASLYTAHGYGLDVFGKIYGIERNGDSDAAFRIRLLTRQMLTMLQPDYSSVNKAFLSVFGCTSNDIKFSETENPFEYRFDQFPLKVVTDAGMNIDQASRLANSLVPATGMFVSINYSTDPISASLYASAVISSDAEVTINCE